MRARITAHAPWLLHPDLGVCVVGSSALSEAVRRSSESPRALPAAHDLDLAWSCDLATGEALLAEHGVNVPTTDLNRGRGTLAFRLDGARIEITSFRGADSEAPLRDRIHRDLAHRDMTIGAVAWWLAEDRIEDPHGGVADWEAGVLRAVGDPVDRVREHPIRWIRYFRKAHTLGLELDRAIRKLALPHSTFDETPAEAISAEFRHALTDMASPGRWLMELFEVGLLQHLAPELAPQFDGRPAGPIRHHPEVGQGLHLILALEWAVDRTRTLDPEDAYAVRFAVLCHDLGKGFTPAAKLPSHPGHESSGLPHIESLCDRMPGLANQRTRNLALRVCELHLLARGMDDLRPGTLARMYDEVFRGKGLRHDLFALAVAADSAGRLGRSTEGDSVAARVEADLDRLCAACESVDAGALRQEHPDTDAFRAALHEARAGAIRRARSAK